MRLGLWLTTITLLICCATNAGAETQQGLEPLLSDDTRLMVFSPHPDDESLGAAGLMQRVLSKGGKVKVVFMTSGDGYTEGVQKQEHIANPRAIAYRTYGKDREREAMKALSLLGLKSKDVVFLGFPDGGLCYLLSKYRREPLAYTSPFTMESRPQPADVIVPDTRYNDQDLRKELVRLMGTFRPTIVAMTPAEDQHPDHCSTYHFVREALKDLHDVDPTIDPKVFTFLVHFSGWPGGNQPSGAGPMRPPRDFTDKEAKWVSLPLHPEEVAAKRRAIDRYQTQMVVIGWFLKDFARPNELFIVTDPEREKSMDKLNCPCS